MAPVEVAMRRNATAVAKSTPGAIGNNETRSGEFCRGMMLFIGYFSRSARILLLSYPALFRLKPKESFPAQILHEAGNDAG
ncbi:hypothetical protein B6C78_25765 [Escherichia coli]|nr:hypothetical protein [Escherichia coli]